jgi:threonine dehydrogenase-like Zn-dependent dehydrogenase
VKSRPLEITSLDRVRASVVRPGIPQTDGGEEMMQKTMMAAFLPGNSTVELRSVAVPEPGHGEVLLRMKASTICGSDIRAIYHEHLGKGPEGYQGVIAGHEPCGQIVETGPECRRFQAGDRVIVYHISGCGVCNDCRRGYMISCTSEKYRRAYGWQRDGGMAEYMLAEEKDLIALPEPLSFADGAQVACGFGTVFEGLQKIGIDGTHAVLITGLGPVGLATGALCRKLGANKVIGIDVVPERMQIALDLGLCDTVLASGPDNVQLVRELTGGFGVERAVDCSAHFAARATAIRATRKWGKIVFIGEGGKVEFNPSPDIIHDQKTIYGSWVTSTWLMEELVERLVRWNLHPADIITHRFSLNQAAEAYALMASGKCGKVAVCQDEELA